MAAPQRRRILKIQAKPAPNLFREPVSKTGANKQTRMQNMRARFGTGEQTEKGPDWQCTEITGRARSCEMSVSPGIPKDFHASVAKPVTGLIRDHHLMGHQRETPQNIQRDKSTDKTRGGQNSTPESIHIDSPSIHLFCQPSTEIQLGQAGESKPTLPKKNRLALLDV
jgi:hypothetical protein